MQHLQKHRIKESRATTKKRHTKQRMHNKGLEDIVRHTNEIKM